MRFTGLKFNEVRVCEVHGEVGGGFNVHTTDDPDYTTGDICAKCYVDWVSQNVRKTHPRTP